MGFFFSFLFFFFFFFFFSFFFFPFLFLFFLFFFLQPPGTQTSSPRISSPRSPVSSPRELKLYSTTVDTPLVPLNTPKVLSLRRSSSFLFLVFHFFDFFLLGRSRG